jgi:hypothetical protein
MHTEQTAPGSIVELRAMAHWLAAHGQPVHPLRPGDKRPASPKGVHDATTDVAAVAAWWAHRPYNVGLSTGGAGLLVVDLDVPHGGRELPAAWTVRGAVTGADVLALLADQAGDTTYADTRTIVTPSGGRHLYYRAPWPLPSSTSRLGPLIDTRGVGGYVVVPPSTTAAGRYVTVNAGPVAPCPAWIADSLAAPAAPVGEQRTMGPRSWSVPAQERSRSARYGAAALADEARAVATALPGTRNHTLNRAAFNLARLIATGDLDRTAVIATLCAAAQAAGLGTDEAARTVASGLNATRPARTA